MLRSDVPEIQDLFPGEPKAHEPAIDLKGSVFTLPVLCIRSCELEAIDVQLGERLAKSPKFFDNAPIVIDLEAIRDSDSDFDFFSFVRLMHARHLFPVGVQNGSAVQHEAAMSAGLAVLKGRAMKELPTAASRRKSGAGSGAKEQTSDTPPEPEDTQSAPPSPPESTTPIHAASSEHTKVVHHPVRSGQRVMARNGDLIVLGAVSAGAEIIAEGNIHVYAPMRGRALAGVSGDTNARIFCHDFAGELVAVAGNYRVFDDNIPKDLRGKSVQVYLDGEQLIVAPLD